MEDNKQTMRPFRLDEPQYNMATYTGRLSHFFKIFNPM